MAAAVVATTQVKAAQERARNQPTEEERAEAAEAAATAKAEKDVYDLANPIRHLIEQFFDIINGNGLQTLLYLLFVIIFQSLLNTTRIPEEYYLDKHVMDRIVENHFDSSHNTFESIRRVADIYEWGNNVLWPGLFGDQGPCQSDGIVGSRETAHAKACTDTAWADGEGSFHQDGATPYSVSELLVRFNQFDWTDGILLRQVRQKPASCSTTRTLGSVCYPEYVYSSDAGSRASFGFNYSHPDEPPDRPFVYMSPADAGGNPEGVVSAAVPSMRTYESGGFFALAIPFFSETFLPEEAGAPRDVTDFREHYVNTTNGRTARCFCVRTSTDGYNLEQLCDPGTNGNCTGRLTGVVRQKMELWWNDLKRSHFLDEATRSLSVVLQMRSNPLGINYRITLMLELTSPGAVLPSFDVETRITDSKASSDMWGFACIALTMVIFFSLLEGVEVAKIGFTEYFQDMWNVMDWANYILYYVVFAHIAQLRTLHESPSCESHLCAQMGYHDDWEVLSTYRSMKTFLSLCVCIQLFKILKFASVLIPKMGLTTATLRTCAIDLLFFGIAFVISMLAFSMMLFVQLGPVMEGYYNQIPAFVALFRALFGDFDIDEIMGNSSGYLNALLFLSYLFVSLFIMVSMFVAILAEAFVAETSKTKELLENDPTYSEYGVLSTATGLLGKYTRKAMRRLRGAPAESEEQSEEAAAEAGVEADAGPAEAEEAADPQSAQSAEPAAAPTRSVAIGGLSMALEAPSENRSVGTSSSSPPPSSKRAKKKAAAPPRAPLAAEPAVSFPFEERMGAMEARLEAIDENFSLILRAVGNLEALMTRQAAVAHTAAPYAGGDAATPAPGQPSRAPPSSSSATAAKAAPPGAPASPTPTEGFTLRGFVAGFGTPTSTAKATDKPDALVA